MARGRLRMAGGPSTDGHSRLRIVTGSSADRYRVVCGWPEGRLRMAGEVVCGWPGVVRGWRSAVPDGQRLKVGSIGVSAGTDPFGRLLDPGLAVVLFSSGLPTTLAIRRNSTKKDVRKR